MDSVLHDDANFLEHELSYIDVLLDKNADQATKDNKIILRR